MDLKNFEARLLLLGFENPKHTNLYFHESSEPNVYVHVYKNQTEPTATKKVKILVGDNFGDFKHYPLDIAFQKILEQINDSTKI